MKNYNLFVGIMLVIVGCGANKASLSDRSVDKSLFKNLRCTWKSQGYTKYELTTDKKADGSLTAQHNFSVHEAVGTVKDKTLKFKFDLGDERIFVDLQRKAMRSNIIEATFYNNVSSKPSAKVECVRTESTSTRIVD